MAILDVMRMGHPVLREKARALTPEEIVSPQIHQLIDDMYETMVAHGGIGIAAPQVGQPLQLSIIDVKASDPDFAKESGLGLEVFCNPILRILDETYQTFWEGCLSVPGLRGEVARPQAVEVTYLNADAETKVIQAQGFIATVFQHEFDHLDGVLYVDRLTDSKKLVFQEEFQQFWMAGSDVREV